MNKNELIHMHGLLCKIREFVDETGEEVETPDYDAMDVSPMGLHRSKKAHKDAVFALATDLTIHVESVESPPAEQALAD